MAPKTVIRKASDSDLKHIVEIHLRSFPNFFLTFLGPAFLTLLYKSIQSDSEGICLVALENGEIKGFVAGASRQSGFYDRLIKNKKWAFARASFGALARNPAIALRLLRALKLPQESESACAQASLMSIAVRPDTQGRGLGKRLVQAFGQELLGRGIFTFSLTTDKDNNEATNSFYRNLGFRLFRTYLTPERRAMNEYLITLDQKKA